MPRGSNSYAFKEMQTDEARIKKKLVSLIESSHEVDAVVALATAFAKVRAVELKQEEGEWAAALENDRPEQPNDFSRNT